MEQIFGMQGIQGMRGISGAQSFQGTNSLESMLMGALGSFTGNSFPAGNVSGGMPSFMNFSPMQAVLGQLFAGMQAKQQAALEAQKENKALTQELQKSQIKDKTGKVTQEGNGGNVHYTTPGGHKVDIQKEGDYPSVVITDNNGKQTRVWGDPHVTEPDGAQWTWKGKEATLTLEDGTKITMGAESPNGAIKKVDIYTNGKLTTDMASGQKASRIIQHVSVNAENPGNFIVEDKSIKDAGDKSLGIAEAFQKDGYAYVYDAELQHWKVVYNEASVGERVQVQSKEEAEKAYQLDNDEARNDFAAAWSEYTTEGANA